jgi:hypothetical protein
VSGRSPSVGGTCRSHGTDYRAGGVMLARDRTAPDHSSGGGASTPLQEAVAADRMCRTHPLQKRAAPPRRQRLPLIRTPDSSGLYRPSTPTRRSRHTSGTRSRPSKLDHSNPSRPPQWPRSRPDITDRAGWWPRFGIVGLAGLAVRRPAARCFSAQRGGRREDDPSHCCRPICCRCCCAGSGVRMEQVCRDGFSVHRRVTSAAEQACASA